MESVRTLATAAHYTENREGDGTAPSAMAHEDLGTAARLQTNRGGNLKSLHLYIIALKLEIRYLPHICKLNSKRFEFFG